MLKLLACLSAIPVLVLAAQTPPTQNAPSPQAAGQTPEPVTTPSMTGPLQLPPPIVVDAGPLGKLDVDGVVSGMGLLQGNPFPGDEQTRAALSNGQLFIQKTTGWWQFYVQPGAYIIPELGVPFLGTTATVSDFFGPVPVYFLKLAPGKNTSIMIGSLYSVMGAEYTFSFQNMNIERGLLWDQENDLNRGIQVNQTVGKFTAAFSWNDGFYSNRYSWLSGALSYADGPHTVTFSAMGNLGQTVFRTVATPVQNNSSMYALIYTYKKGSWIVQPYVQYTNVPTNPKVGVAHGAATRGGALLLSRTLTHGFSLAGRGEYISSTGNAAERAVNLILGPGSAAWSVTLTPTYQHKIFFVRGELSFVRATRFTAGDAFGPAGTDRNQPRALVEAGFLF